MACLPLLALGAIWSNADFLFGASQEEDRKPSREAAPAEAEEEFSVSQAVDPTNFHTAKTAKPQISVSGESISEKQMKQYLNQAPSISRDPTKTEEKQAILQGNKNPWEGKQQRQGSYRAPVANLIWISANGKKKFALIQGEILREGDTFAGGKIVAIQEDKVIVQRGSEFQMIYKAMQGKSNDKKK